MNDEWISLVGADEMADGEAREFVAAGRMIALFRVAGEFHALDGVCPHQGGPLGRGCLQGEVVTCPWHGWQYHVKTGQHQIAPSVKQPVIPLQVIDGVVVVRRRDLED